MIFVAFHICSRQAGLPSTDKPCNLLFSLAHKNGPICIWDVPVASLLSDSVISVGREAVTPGGVKCALCHIGFKLPCSLCNLNILIIFLG